jgi:hypothetical protein
MVNGTEKMVSGVEKIFSVVEKIFSVTKIMVTAAQKMLSVAFAVFFATEQIASAQTQWSIQHRLRPLRFGSPLSKPSFANPTGFFLELIGGLFLMLFLVVFLRLQ